MIFSGETGLTAGSGFFLLLALGLALTFEFVNGFHDTANAVATVIYTRSLSPILAVCWSGLWNLIGVLVSHGTIAFGIIALLPVELVINAGSGAGFAMVFALLISAIIWNLGTWYLALPASSSHTLVGSIIGVGLGNSLLASGKGFGEGVNWAQAKEVGLSLLISPIVGFCCSALLFLLAKATIKAPELYRAPASDKPPPFWIRSLLVGTCTGVSFAHGSNDGQKGMGLIMLILIGVLPGTYALNLATPTGDLRQILASSHAVERVLTGHPTTPGPDLRSARTALATFLDARGHGGPETLAALGEVNRQISETLSAKPSLDAISPKDRESFRNDTYLMTEAIGKLDREKGLSALPGRNTLLEHAARLRKLTRFIPGWVKLAVACALGIGTMVGWKRIVVTVGEKIGKEHLTYAQGAAAELVAMATIGASDYIGVPVSTTHVLSSGVAGAMAANHSGLQMGTLRNLLLAWVLTLPVCVLLGAMTFAAGLFIVFNVLGLK